MILLIIPVRVRMKAPMSKVFLRDNRDLRNWIGSIITEYVKNMLDRTKGRCYPKKEIIPISFVGIKNCRGSAGEIL